jgi:hypothetical protein
MDLNKHRRTRTEGAIKNGQSRETGNIEHTRHKMMTNKSTTQYILDTNIPNKHKKHK